MSLNKSEEYNEIYMKKYLLLKPKTKLIRSIYNNKKQNVKNQNNYELNSSDLISSISSYSESEEFNDNISNNENCELIKNTDKFKYKYHELKCISVITDLFIPKIIKIEENNSHFLKTKEINSNKIKDYETNYTTEMQISYNNDEEISSNNSEYEINSKFLPCRYEEQKEIYTYIKNGLKNFGSYNSLYICGLNGTGKTECVKRVIEIIEQENKVKDDIQFRYLFINCVNFDTDMKLIKYIYNFIFSKKSKKMKSLKYLNILDEFFSKRNYYNGNIYLNDPSNSHIILIIDEIDYLINKFQILLYHIFNWSSYSNSKLIIISMSNLININDLFLAKISSIFGQNKLILKPYTKQQIREIINYKGINLNLFDEDALKLTSMKVSFINGDLRRVILILNYAIELYNYDIKNNMKNNNTKLINKFYIIKACNNLFGSKIINTFKNLKILEKIIIGAILFAINKYNYNLISTENTYNTLDILLEKYNEYNKNNNEIELDINWEEFKIIIYNLNRMKLIELRNNNISNFKDGFITIKFFADEFSVACESDEDFKLINHFLENSSV